MMQHVIQTLMGAIGAVGFAVLFNVRGRRLLLFFLGGALDWAVYLLCTENGCTMFTGLLFATMTAALSSEILARVIHAPVLILLVPMLIPLIPGGALYYTMNYALNEQWPSFADKAVYTLGLAAALALGIIAVTTLTRMTMVVVRYLKGHKLPGVFH